MLIHLRLVKVITILMSFNVTDNVDPTANITTTTTGADTVDTNTPGNYAVVYTATDSW